MTLEKMLQAGDDHHRWSASRAARVEGYVVSIANGPIELTNCYLPCSRDIYIHIGLRPDAPPREQVVLEITPRMQEWARLEGRDWSEETLRGDLLTHWCSFEGWLFDVAKYPEAKFESTEIKPGGEKGATHTVTGNLTLHGVTKSITFPATITVTPPAGASVSGSAASTASVSASPSPLPITSSPASPASPASPSAITVDSTFAINRKDFGINYAGAADNLIRDEVLLTLKVRGTK